MLRIGLFLLTNIAVIAVASITLSLLGVGRYLDQSGNLDLQTLLIFCAVFALPAPLFLSYYPNSSPRKPWVCS